MRLIDVSHYAAEIGLRHQHGQSKAAQRLLYGVFPSSLFFGLDLHELTGKRQVLFATANVLTDALTSLNVLTWNIVLTMLERTDLVIQSRRLILGGLKLNILLSTIFISARHIVLQLLLQLIQLGNNAIKVSLVFHWL